jgi:hypothetical protein
MINKTNGHLIISPEIELAPKDSFQKIDNLKLGENQETSDMKTGYKWLTTRNVKINQEYFILSFCFFNDQFVELNFFVDDNKFALNAGWDLSDTEYGNLERRYKKWVNEKLGHEGQFPWGEVFACFDPKSGFSSITIRYK